MRRLPSVDDHMFPANTRPAIARFWIAYWGWFFLLLPWMLFRQVFISLHQFIGALWTWNRRIDLFGGQLSLVFMTDWRTLAITLVFGERFTAIRYGDVLIDPGPPVGRRQLERYLRATPGVAAIVATHAHEEHVGNAGFAAQLTGAAVYGTPTTLAAIRSPGPVSRTRRVFMGQPQPVDVRALRTLSEGVSTPAMRLQAIESPGHCDGHASVFDAERGVLFAGDSFLHTIFTSPNADASGDEWISTFERYGALDIRTMIGTHGSIYSSDPALERTAFITRRGEPNRMIREKLEFLRWARDVIAEGERRGAPYSVIEACLFPWQHWWSWGTWFTDESGRPFSGGEFSRTQFVRSMSKRRESVPARFPWFVRLATRLTGGAR